MNCTNPSAVNFDPLATSDDGSCVYLHKIGSTCYAFKDLDPGEQEDKSFTVSWSLEQKGWVFFHDYTPDFYIHTREALYTMTAGTISKHNAGAPGSYGGTVKPFFIDMVFPNQREFIVNTFSWLSEVLSAGKAKEQLTFTHLTAWNNFQCTGRIALSSIFDLLQYKTHRKTQGLWTLNDFRDIVKDNEAPFLNDLFSNFSVKSAAVNPSLPWYEKQLLSDTFVIVRLEFDNTSGNKIYLHDADINADPQTR
jgi:hypothetical protein